MKYRFNGIKTDIDVPMSALPGITAKKLGIAADTFRDFEVRRKSVDARKKPYIQFVYTVDFVTDKKLRIPKKFAKDISTVDEAAAAAAVMPPDPGDEPLETRPVVVGAGPCGLFAGLELAKAGYRPLIIERGPAMDGRVEAVEKFRKDRVLDPEANMLFGEGGAGTFSDGKLTTGIRDDLIREVLKEFRDAGAGEDIMYLAKPHIGTDVLRKVIVEIRNKIISLGGEVLFDTRLESFEVSGGRLSAINIIRKGSGNKERIETGALILAIGHSARDTFAMVNGTGLDMQQKPFSIGVRIEHPQSLIDASQYGAENVGKLPAANYKVNYKASNGRGVYSFA